MGRPKLSLQFPAEYTITLNPAEGATDSVLHGRLCFARVPPQCDIQITLVRAGRLRRGKEIQTDTASRKFISELGFMGSQKEQRREQFDYERAEKLCGCFVRPPHAPSGSKTLDCNFELPIPSYLPATTTLSSVEVSYAIIATCVLPNGKTLQTSRDLRINRKNADIIALEPSRTVSFPETTFAVRASFNSPNLGAKDMIIKTTLQLDGLKLPMNDTMRLTETRWLVLREIKWEFEETAVIVVGFSDATGHIPMSTAQRTLKKRKLATGKEKLKLRYPFTRSGNTPVNMLPDGTGMRIPFIVTVPKAIALGDSTALSVAGGHIMHTVLSSDRAVDTNLPQERFAVYLEYKLHIWLRIGEDVFDEASGDLTNRKMDEMAYTVVCPLTTQSAQSAEMSQDDEPAPVVPPSYDGVWEHPPPEYTTYS